MLRVLVVFQGAAGRLRARLAGEDGLSTAELLGNAALGIAALVAIWGALRALGFDIIEWIRSQLQIG